MQNPKPSYLQLMSRYQPTGTEMNPYASGQVMDKNRQLNLIYELVNDPGLYSQSGYMAGYMQEHGYDLLLPGEKQIFNMLFNTRQMDGAWEFLDDLQDILYHRRREKLRPENEAYAEEKGVLASGRSLATNLGATFMAPFQYLKTAIDKDTHRYDPIFDWNYETRDIRSVRREEWEKLIPYIGSAVYDAIIGMGDMAVAYGTGQMLGGGNAAFAKKISQVFMGSQTAGSTLLEGLERGLSGEQAIALGLGAGIADSVASKFALDKVLQSPAVAKHHIIKNLAGAGSSEAVVELYSQCLDLMIAGDQSHLMQEYQALMDDGLTESEATTQVLMNCLKNTGLNVLTEVLLDAGSTSPEMGFAKGKAKGDFDLGQSKGPDLQDGNSFRHTVAHMDPDDPAFANHQAFLKTYQTDYRNLVLWQSELKRAYRDGASDKEIQWIKDTIARTESRLKKKEHQGPFSLALEAGEAAKAQGRYREVTYEIPGILDRPRKQIIMEGRGNNLPSNSEVPFEVYDLTRGNGETKQRRLFDGNRSFYTDYDADDHGKPKWHPMGGHKHLYDGTIEDGDKRSKDFEITLTEVIENSDIYSLGEGGNVRYVSGIPHVKRR